MCGEHRSGFNALFPNGIIPACAGSTKRFSSTEMPFRDHPRMCGEHFGSLNFSFTLTGSSPHVRGAHRSSQTAES